MRLWNHVVFLLHSEKTKFFDSLSPSHSSKEFWKLVKLLRGGKHPISNLTEGDVQAVTDVDKANMFNFFFAKCWNYSDDPLPLSPQCCVDSEPLLPDDMRCTVDDVHHYICSMDPSKT